ncbi:SRPBCC family protein [Halobacteriovorax sp. JY17]|uniref:SRPBCC family protein n=1 Tax=Halobacteriovorax sp. JY17 TaxID=2014617 RepID=UPI0025C2867B|nr:SRPBCC family protein [Halobacteriovorax sp. JY17]
MKKILYLFLIFISFNSLSLELVQSTGSIDIKAPIDKVFDLVSSPMNDHLWRSEVNDMTTNNHSVEIGSWYREDAWIGIRRNFITTTEVIEVDPPYKVIFTTIEGSPYFLKSRRFFTEKSGVTTFTYIVDFDRRMIKETFGVNISPKIVMKLYKFQMKRYLKKLKKEFER